MTQYHYEIVNTSYSDALKSKANELGRDGWRWIGQQDPDDRHYVKMEFTKED